jgi:ribonuclease HII
MRRAIERLRPAPDFLLVDAISVDLPLAQRALIHGDALSQCIAAASILAKQERDACLCEWDRVFPEYGLKSHKGYCTDQHWKALEKHGPTSVHRFSFWPVRDHSRQAVWSGYPRQAELFTEQDAVEPDSGEDFDFQVPSRMPQRKRAAAGSR